MNHNFVFTVSLKKKILVAILVVFCKKSENYSIFVKINCQFSLCFLFLLPSQKKKRRQGISDEIDGD